MTRLGLQTVPVAPGGPDEVGRLSTAFGVMVGKVRDTLAEIHASRQMAVLGEFAAHLSHEVRNPLTSIKLNLQKLDREQRDGRLPVTAGVPLDLALREVARLDRVVHGVLDLARARPSNRQPASLHAVIAEALEAIGAEAEARGIRLERQLTATVDRVAIDIEGVRGAIVNLVLNAIQASSRGGRIRVMTSSTSEAIRVAVADEGPGVAEAARTRIFEPFFSGRDGGTGLGLPMARRVIEDNEGTLTLTTTAPAGAGAEFVVTLPISAAP